MCQNESCPIFSACDKEQEQARYCRKVELLVHLSKIKKIRRPFINYVKTSLLPVLM